MNRTDRLLALVLKLQSNGRQRAEDLAAAFETSKRTIYCDIQALSEAGVPVVALPGQGDSLMEGYFLPPLEEAEANDPKGIVVRALFDTEIAPWVREARSYFVVEMEEKVGRTLGYAQGSNGKRDHAGC